MIHSLRIARRKHRYLILAIILLIVLNTIGFASEWQLPPLEVITADNVSRITEIARLGSGSAGTPIWSPDERVFLLDSARGYLEYHMDDLANPTVHRDLERVESFSEMGDGFIARLENGEEVYVDLKTGERSMPPPRPTPSPHEIQQTLIATGLKQWSLGLERLATRSDDGRYMVIEEHIEPQGSALLHVIDMQSGLEVTAIEGESSTVQSYWGRSFDPVFDERGLLFMRDRTLYRWYPDTNEEKLLVSGFVDITLSPQTHYVINYAIIPTLIADIPFQVWDISGDEAILLHAQLFRGTDWWESIAFHPTRPIVATGGHNSNIRQWDVRTLGASFVEDNPPVGHGHYDVPSIHYIRDGRYLIGHEHPYAGAATGFIRDARTGEQLVTLFSDHNQSIASLEVDSNEQNVAFGLRDGTLVIWKLDDLLGQREVNVSRAQHVLKGHTAIVWRITYSADGRWLASASEDGIMTLWDTTTDSQVISGDFGEDVRGLAFRPDGTALAVGDKNGRVTLVSTTPAALRVPFVSVEDAAIRRLLYTEDGSLLVGLDDNPYLYFWNASTGETLAEIDLQHPSEVSDITFNHDGTLIGAADSWGRVRLFGVPVD